MRFTVAIINLAMVAVMFNVGAAIAAASPGALEVRQPLECLEEELSCSTDADCDVCPIYPPVIDDWTCVEGVMIFAPTNFPPIDVDLLSVCRCAFLFSGSDACEYYVLNPRSNTY